MKLNKECIRDIMLAIESEPYGSHITKFTVKDNNFLSKYDVEEIIYTLHRLLEADYVNADIQYAADEVYTFYISSLTWNGHQFLDNIRDDGVWKKTKSIAGKFSSVSISLLSSIASGVITQLINQQLGNP